MKAGLLRRFNLLLKALILVIVFAVLMRYDGAFSYAAKGGPDYIRVGLLFNQSKVSLYSPAGLVLQEKDSIKAIAKGSFSYIVQADTSGFKIDKKKISVLSIVAKSSDFSTPVYLNNKPYRGVLILLLDEKNKLPCSKVRPDRSGRVSRSEKHGFWLELLGGAKAQLRRFRKTLISKMDFEQLSEKIRLQGIPSGKFVLRHDTPQQDCGVFRSQNKITVINYVDFEQYLAGVMGGEVPASWPLEALKAQAVAARTYAIYKINHRPERYFDVYSTDQDQVYGGVLAEHPSLNQALSETKGEVLTYKGSLIKAFYHSTCGGQTEEGGEVFGMAEPYLSGVKDPYCIGTPVRDWLEAFTQDDIRNAFKKQNIDIGAILSITPVMRDKSGRVRVLKIAHSKGTEYLPGYEFRRIMGYRNLRSSYFTVSTRGYVRVNIKKQTEVKDSTTDPKPGDVITLNSPVGEVTVMRHLRLLIIKSASEISIINFEESDNSKALKERRKVSSRGGAMIKKVPYMFVIKGHGWGHGVGMCQWGARGMALKGFNYKQILKYYYPGIEITKINS